MPRKYLPLTLYVDAEPVRMSDDGSYMFTLSISPDPDARDSAERAGEYHDSKRWPSKLGPLDVEHMAITRFPAKGRAYMIDGGGLELEVRNVYSAGAYDLKRMAKSIETVSRALGRVVVKYGAAESFGAALRRLCEVCGIESIRVAVDTVKLWRDVRSHEPIEHRRIRFDVSPGIHTVVRAMGAIVDPSTVDRAPRETGETGETH